MKHALFWAIALVSLSATSVTFAATTPATVQTTNGQIMYTAEASTGNLSVVEIKSIDDRNLTITFNEDLAEEPIRFKLLEQETKKEVAISSIGVNPKDRKTVEVKLGVAIEVSKKYALALSYARGMSGANIDIPANEDKTNKATNETSASDTLDGNTANAPKNTTDATTDFNAPKDITTSNETKKQADATVSSDELKTANEAAIDEASKQPLPPARLDSAPNADTAGANASGVLSPVEGKDAHLVNGATQLPKTGPETWVAILASLSLGATYFYKRKYATVKN